MNKQEWETERKALLAANRDHQKQIEKLKELAQDRLELIDIARAAVDRLNKELAEAKEERKEIGEELEKLFKKGFSSFKYTNLSEGVYYLTFPYDDFIAVQNKFKLGK